MKKKVQVRLIATNKPSVYAFQEGSNELHIAEAAIKSVNIPGWWKPQHVVLISDDEIKEWDYVLLPDNSVIRMTPTDMADYLDSQSKATKKIAASTEFETLPSISAEDMRWWLNEGYPPVEI